MKGFMKFIGADKAEVQPAAEATAPPPKEAPPKKPIEKTESNSEKSVLKMIQSKLGITFSTSSKISRVLKA